MQTFFFGAATWSGDPAEIAPKAPILVVVLALWVVGVALNRTKFVVRLPAWMSRAA